MFINLLNSLNYISFNIDAARIFGLNTAIYCAELLNIYRKAELKNKLIDNNYFKVDRKFICNRTTITIEEQLKIDINLNKINIINRYEDDPNTINFDIKLFASIISSEDVSLIENISKKVKIKNPKGTKATQRQIILKNLKDSISCSNYELLTALRNWVDSIYANPNGYISKKGIELFQTTLNNYAKGDLDLALKIVNIAITQSYKNCDWAINIYEKDKKIKMNNELFANNHLPRVTEQRKATEDTINKDEVF